VTALSHKPVKKRTSVYICVKKQTGEKGRKGVVEFFAGHFSGTEHELTKRTSMYILDVYTMLWRGICEKQKFSNQETHRP